MRLAETYATTKSYEKKARESRLARSTRASARARQHEAEALGDTNLEACVCAGH
jgi:hypothetical protein